MGRIIHHPAIKNDSGAILEPTEWQRIGDQINAAMIFTRRDFVNVHQLGTVMLGILRSVRRPQRRGSEIHAESFAPYRHGAVFRQIQVAANCVVLVADVALDDPKIDETSMLHRCNVLRVVGGNHVNMHIRTV